MFMLVYTCLCIFLQQYVFVHVYKLKACVLSVSLFVIHVLATCLNSHMKYGCRDATSDAELELTKGSSKHRKS